jgi:uncharacterized membrane protein
MEKPTISIIDAPGYVRDPQSGAVILKNQEHMDKYKLEKQRRLEEIRKMTALQNEVDLLKKDLDELKSIVSNLQK